ncbi:MAG TPA: DsbE family thiol:disulfide interchange protein [Rhizomicrobium sp.]|nr:DsbE family thiol:disulfide interchange protein [Rhizomicrobium sp.]
MRWLLYVIPAVCFVVLAGVLFAALHRADVSPGDALPSALIGKSAPRLEILPLDAAAQGFGPRDLASGHVTVVNVFASWCAPCHSEAPELMRLAGRPDFALYGMVQKDTPAKVRAFLAENGNPFARIGVDADGRAGIEWGVYGVPETFVVDGRGIVRARIVGEITDDKMDRELLPAIEAAKKL